MIPTMNKFYYVYFLGIIISMKNTRVLARKVYKTKDEAIA